MTTLQTASLHGLCTQYCHFLNFMYPVESNTSTSAIYSDTVCQLIIKTPQKKKKENFNDHCMVPLLRAYPNANSLCLNQTRWLKVCYYGIDVSLLSLQPTNFLISITRPFSFVEEDERTKKREKKFST